MLARASRSVRRLLARLAASRACGILLESQSKESQCQATLTFQPIQGSRHSPGLVRGSRRTRLDPPEARAVDRRRGGWLRPPVRTEPSRRPARHHRVDRASGLTGSRLRGAVDPDAARSRVGHRTERCAHCPAHSGWGRSPRKLLRAPAAVVGRIPTSHEEVMTIECLSVPGSDSSRNRR